MQFFRVKEKSVIILTKVFLDGSAQEFRQGKYAAIKKHNCIFC